MNAFGGRGLWPGWRFAECEDVVIFLSGANSWRYLMAAGQCLMSQVTSGFAVGRATEAGGLVGDTEDPASA
jgi:hypothetical protein